MTLPNLGAVATSITPTRIARTREVLRDGNDNLRVVILRRAAVLPPPLNWAGTYRRSWECSRFV